MLIVQVKEGESIERALKRYKRKFKKTKVREESRNRKEFKKTSDRRREEIQKAQYREKYIQSQEI